MRRQTQLRSLIQEILIKDFNLTFKTIVPILIKNGVSLTTEEEIKVCRTTYNNAKNYIAKNNTFSLVEAYELIQNNFCGSLEKTKNHLNEIIKAIEFMEINNMDTSSIKRYYDKVNSCFTFVSTAQDKVRNSNG